MSKYRILIVEDDENISRLIEYNLKGAGFDCYVAFSGEDALESLSREDFDLVILDLMLPGIDGVQVCKTIRKSAGICDTPVIMLTAKGHEVDRIIGFEAGADDYVVKPFSPRELVLRVKAILSRANSSNKGKDVLEFNGIKIDLEGHRVFVEGKEVRLTKIEFNLLTTLFERRGRVQSRDRLLDEIWDISADVTTRTVDTHIKRLRKKLGKAGRFIETVRGIGYRFSEEAGN